MEACLRTVFKVSADASDDADDRSISVSSGESFSRVIWHEAGHTVVSEVLCPESITIVSTRPGEGSSGGFTAYYNDHSTDPLYWAKSRIAGALGGMAAIEQKFGVFDAGNSKDLDQAFDRATALVVNNCVCGLHLHKNSYEDSQRLWSEQEQAVSAEVEKYYKKAKEILAVNGEFLNKVAAALEEKGLLVMEDIKAIKDTCTILPVAI